MKEDLTFDRMLEERLYEELVISRAGDYCDLLITVSGQTHAYCDPKGKQKEYRHAWQIKQWLSDRYAIDPASIKYKEIKYPK
ncbi:MAG: hypothetical protein HC904_16675 [Blastochloris sp.]|nr:hypothetical protein [Blastochloris sp.]